MYKFKNFMLHARTKHFNVQFFGNKKTYKIMIVTAFTFLNIKKL